jgi:hypothetical protein
MKTNKIEFQKLDLLFGCTFRLSQLTPTRQKGNLFYSEHSMLVFIQLMRRNHPENA